MKRHERGCRGGEVKGDDSGYVNFMPATRCRDSIRPGAIGASNFNFPQNEGPLTPAGVNYLEGIYPALDPANSKASPASLLGGYGHVPQHDRTLNDVYAKELYYPDFNILSTTPQQGTRPMSLPSDIFSQRLNAANRQHMSAFDSPSQPSLPEIFDQNANRRSADLSKTQPSGAASSQGYEEMRVPDFAISLIMGRSGETLKLMQDTTGCKIKVIQVADAQPEDATREIVLIGSDDSIMQAKQAIGEKVTEAVRRLVLSVAVVSSVKLTMTW